MKNHPFPAAVLAVALAWHGVAFASTVTIDVSGKAPYELGGKVYLTPKLDGKGQFMTLYVNGIRGGNATVGTVNAQNGVYVAPLVMPAGGAVTITATTTTQPLLSGQVTLGLRLAGPTIQSISPATVACNTPFTLTVTGLRYSSKSTVFINGKAAPTTYVSATRLQATGSTSQSGVIGVKVSTEGLGMSPEQWTVKATTGCGGSTTTSEPSPTPTPTPSTTSIGPQPAADAQTVAAARLLDQTTFGATAADLATVKANGANAWLQQQFAAAPTPMPITSDLNTVRRNWYLAMASAPDQLRQRMIFALSQLFVVSADKNPYGNEIQPWLLTLQSNAFGNFKTLLREMTLNPAMGKYLDLGNSMMPSPNENYAREVMQLFTIGPVLLNQDGSVQLDRNGEPIPSYDQATIGAMAHALSGWTYAGAGTGVIWENMSGPLQPREAYHDKSAKTIVGGITLPAGQTTVQDLDAVLDALFNHPNLPPFIATRLIRHFVTSNPSPAYIARVADVFANGPAGRGDLKATLMAVLTDPEARADSVTATSGHLKDPLQHSLSLVRALGGTVLSPDNLFWEYYLLGQKLVNSPSVFNFYSPLTRLPLDPGYFGPEFQIYAPALAVARANFVYHLLAGEYATMIKIDIAPYVNAAGDPTTLLNLVDAKLLQGRMRPATRDAIGKSLQATTDNKQRALTALYLTAISAEFAVTK